MGVEDRARRKRASAEISKEENESKQSGHTKKKSKSQPNHNGPPAYLLDARRTDPFADPRNIIQDKDRRNCPIIYGQNPRPSAQEASASGPSADADLYFDGNPTTESRSERDASRVASKFVNFAGQNQLTSSPPSSFKPNYANSNSLPSSRRNTPSTSHRAKLGAIKLGLKLDLKQSSIPAHGRTNRQSGNPEDSNISRQATQNSLETQQQSHISQLQQNNARKHHTLFNLPVSNQRSLPNTPAADSGASSPQIEEIASRTEIHTDSLAATDEFELRSHPIVSAPPQQQNKKILLSPPQPARYNRNRKIGESPLRQVTTAEQASEYPSPTRFSSRPHQAFTRSDSNDIILDSPALVEFDSIEALDSTPRKTSTPKRGINRAGFASRGGLTLSSSSHKESNNLPDKDSPQPKDTKPVQTDNPRRTNDNDIITGTDDTITSTDDIISPQGENFLPSSSNDNTTTTKFAQRNRTGNPLETSQTLHTKQDLERQGAQQKTVASHLFDYCLDRRSSQPSESASSSPDRSYSFRRKDNYSRRKPPQQKETLDEMDGYESNQNHSNVYMNDEEYALRLQAEEYGQLFEEPYASTVPTAARYSNVRAESPSSAEALRAIAAGALRAIAGHDASNDSAPNNPRQRRRDSSPSQDLSVPNPVDLRRYPSTPQLRLSGARDLSPRELFLARNPHMKPTPSKLRHEQIRSSDVPYATMSRRSSEEREELEIRRTKRKERDDDDLYEGMRNFRASQRGWNGERESDRQETIRGFHEAEDAKIRAQFAMERAASEASRPPVMTERVSLRQLREGSERVQTRLTLRAIALEDTADRMTEEATSFMMGRQVNMDDIIRDAHGHSNDLRVSGTYDRRRTRSSAPQGNRTIQTAAGGRRSLPQGNRATQTADGRRRSLPQGNRTIQTAAGGRRSLPQGDRAIQAVEDRHHSLPQSNRPTERATRPREVPERILSPSPDRSEGPQISSSPPERIVSPSPSPPTSPAPQSRGHQRVPSGAGSLKENGETEDPPRPRRPADQVRGFGNDITAWAEEERRLEEARAAAREASAANRRSANADDQEADAEN